jgi:drug/metabolite transporter (DMT)-like permease
MAHSRLNTSLLAIFSCLLWSTAFAGVKIGLAYTTPLQFGGTRFFIAGLLVFPLAYRFNPRYFRIVRDNLRLILLLAFMQTLLQNTMFYTGINMIPAAVAAIVIGSQPLFIALVANFFMPGEKMTLYKTGAILLGITGVALVSLGKDPGSATGHVALAGILLVLGVNLVSGSSNILVAREKGRIPPLVISSSSMILGGAALFLVSIPLEGLHPGPRPPVYYLSLTWLSMLSAVAISIWTILLKRPGIVVSDLNLWKFLIPLFGALLSWILLPEEHPQALTATGMFVITFALVISGLLKRKKQRFIQEKA